MSLPNKKLLAVLAASGLVLTACSESEDSNQEAQNTDGRGEITFAMGKNDTDKLRPIIEKWNKEHPEEKVKLQELAGEADAQRDTLVQSLQAGSKDIDVMALDVVWTAQFAANGWLAPLTGELETKTDDLLPATVKSATYNNTLFALPQNTNGQLLYRNTDMVKEEPKNWNDVVEACKKVEGQDCLTTQLKQYEGLTVNTAGFMAGWGGGLTSEDATPTVTSKESQAGLQAMVDAYKDGTISSASTGATEEETNLSFTQGDTAMAINWPYMYENSEADGSAVKGKVEVSPLVGKDGVGVSTLGGYNNGINVNSEHKATALEFMEFITNEENQRSFAEASFPPVRSSIYDEADIQEKFPYMEALKVSLENAQPRPASPTYDALSKAVQDNAYAALTSGKSVEDATKDMEAAIRNTQG
ncbi:ABC transporter substrate-binding protein [Corynebacterium suicordis]|uniref:ABC transporter substrate-binding protein n=1 Tax=Corynebacterium suicordis DSM 45110 TaxID=1121369 RepID=A0ABR9ZHZ5_9CORY|nr:ABC transporter substrate-binding protein [Corynebacterium suicordis]MBF4553012.1 ABC transporter substrate-binding protein [Corynebacterium suicordis DSM 45110]MDR6278026.1 multiple sugar transport system substrate-binding protein [Corynebacterium suicordis]